MKRCNVGPAHLQHAEVLHSNVQREDYKIAANDGVEIRKNNYW